MNIFFQIYNMLNFAIHFRSEVNRYILKVKNTMPSSPRRLFKKESWWVTWSWTITARCSQMAECVKASCLLPLETVSRDRSWDQLKVRARRSKWHNHLRDDRYLRKSATEVLLLLKYLMSSLPSRDQELTEGCKRTIFIADVPCLCPTDAKPKESSSNLVQRTSTPDPESVGFCSLQWRILIQFAEWF